MDLIFVTDSVMQVVIQVKKEEKFFPVAFVAFKEARVLIQQIGIEKGDSIKIEYYLKSKKWKENYSTSAIIQTIKITEKKSQQLTVDMETGEILG